MYIIVATCCYFAIIRLECPDYVKNSLRVHTVLHREWKFITPVVRSYLATVSAARYCSTHTRIPFVLLRGKLQVQIISVLHFEGAATLF